MTAKDNIEDKLNNLSNSIGSDENLVENVMSHINNESGFGCSQAKTQNIWRIIMKSPLTKLTAAAAIIIAVTVGIFNIDFNTRVYGLTDVPEIIRQAETIHITSWGVGIKLPVTDELNLDEIGLCKDYWIDLKNGRYNLEEFNSTRNTDTDDVNDNRIKDGGGTEVFDGQYFMQISRWNESAQFERLTDFQRILSVRQTTDKFLDEIYINSDDLADFVKSGTEQIDGEDYDIWENIYDRRENIQDVNLPAMNFDSKRQYWVSPSSGRLRKLLCWSRIAGTNEPWQLTNEKNIQINQTPPDNIFKTEVPEGYSASNTKESAITRRLESTSFSVLTPDYQRKTLGEVKIAMDLPDRTLIMAWNSRVDSMVELLEQINSGDEILEIPLELNYSLEHILNPENVSYSVQHIAETQKDGVFYNWYIYVPDKDMSGGKNLNVSFGYLWQYRLVAESLRNVPREPYMSLSYSMAFPIDLNVQGEEDFNTFVLGAMAELSDNGKAPEGITYEKVLRLAQQIRGSLAK